MKVASEGNISLERVKWLDALRVFACFSVVVIHVIGNTWNKADPSSLEWNLLNIINSITRPAVPLFVMISGALLLNPIKTIEIKDILIKYVPRIITLFIFWSAFYSIITTVYLNQDIKYGLRILGTGYAHLWYLFLYLGLCLSLPILRCLVLDKEILKYFLILGLIFNFILPVIESSLQSEVLSYDIKQINFNLVMGYIPYFISGYFFSIVPMKKSYIYLLYLGGGIGLIFSVIFSAINSKYGQALSYVSYLHPFNMMESLAIFIFFKESNKYIKKKNIDWFSSISKYSLGIYLIHPLIIMIFHKITKIEVSSFHCLLTVPIISCSVFIISLIVTNLISKIKILKHIV